MNILYGTGCISFQNCRRKTNVSTTFWVTLPWQIMLTFLYIHYPKSFDDDEQSTAESERDRSTNWDIGCNRDDRPIAIEKSTQRSRTDNENVCIYLHKLQTNPKALCKRVSFICEFECNNLFQCEMSLVLSTNKLFLIHPSFIQINLFNRPVISLVVVDAVAVAVVMSGAATLYTFYSKFRDRVWHSSPER